MFGIGRWAYDTVKGVRVQVIGREDLWGYVSCQVYEPVSKTVYRISGEYLSSQPAGNYSVSYVRYMAALARVKQALAESMIADLNESVLPLPHQLYALNRAVAAAPVKWPGTRWPTCWPRPAPTCCY